MIRGESGSKLATTILEKLAAYYLRPDIEEVVINHEKQIWTKPRRADWTPEDAPELTYEYIHKVCRVLANINQARFSEDDLPVVSCELPGAPFRFQAIIGPNVRYELSDRRGIAVAIRALTAASIEMKDYGLTPDARLPGSNRFEDFEITGDHIEKIKKVIDAHYTVIISGATSTGKTTFTNRLIAMINSKARIITVEDARELTVPHPNRIHLMVPRNRSANAVDYNVIIDSLMRLTPDWVICGEVSVHNAAALYSLMGKGHPLMSTVHAGSPEEAIRAFTNNMATAGSRLDPESTGENLKRQIGCIIQLDRVDGKRRVVEITFPRKDIADAPAAATAPRA